MHVLSDRFILTALFQYKLQRTCVPPSLFGGELYLTKAYALLTHWGRVTHICVGNTTIIGADNGLSPDRRQAIIWTHAGILLIGPLGTKFSEILIVTPTFSFKRVRWKMVAILSRPQCVKRCECTRNLWDYIDGLVQESSISTLQCISHGDTAVLHLAIDTYLLYKTSLMT